MSICILGYFPFLFEGRVLLLNSYHIAWSFLANTSFVFGSKAMVLKIRQVIRNFLLIVPVHGHYLHSVFKALKCKNIWDVLAHSSVTISYRVMFAATV